MNRKLFAICALLMVALSVSAVSAFDVGDLFGLGKDSTVEIGGVEFNIPEGFIEDTKHESVNESAKSGSIDYILNGKCFEKNSTIVSILVADYGKYNVTDKVLSEVGDEKATINGINGYITYDGDLYVFSYEKNSDLVSISTNDKDVIGDFLIA